MEWLRAAGSFFCALSAAEHVLIFAMETFLWRGRGRKLFRASAAQAAPLAGAMAQLGVYNLTLALGLLWALARHDTDDKLLFLTFVWLVAAFGATSLMPRILLTQGSPALLGLLCVVGSEKQFDDLHSWGHGAYWLLGSVGLVGSAAALAGALWKRNDLACAEEGASLH
ncbi:hypothetical protein AB1Y20_005905 [Prymnesium parvum]|uniref:Uncharacterized protein n=1 Tax=Prymnesium parvum TaxID=97485 RepID=A0AB34J0V8_PRYPA